MKNTLQTKSRSTGRLHAAFSFCRHGLLLLSSLAAISAQAGQPTETVFIGGTSALSVDDFGIARSVATPLTAITVITGTVWSGPTTDKITFTLPADYKIDSASVTVTNYVAAGGTPDTGPRVLFKNGSTTYGSVAFSGNGNNIVQFTSPVPAGPFDLQITAPSGLQSGGTFAESFTPNAGPNVPTVTYGSASYVITLNISRIIFTVPIAELAGSYIGLVQSNSKIKGRIAQIVSATLVKPIPNEDLNARLDMTVTANGTVTGKLVYGPTQVAFSTIFTTSTVNNVLVAPPKLVIPIPDYNRSLVLNFGTDDEEDAGYIDGALVQQGDESDQFFSNTRGWKNTWTTARRPVPAYTSYKTFTLYGRFSSGEGGAPQGKSFGSVKAEAAVGTYLAAGTLADGQKFTTTGFYGPSGDFLIYQYLYASLGKGSFSARASVNSQDIARVQEADEVQVPTIRGEFRWLKQPSPPTTTVAAPGRPKRFSRPVRITGPSDTLYPEGFEGSGPINGATYTPPAAGQVLNVSGSRIDGTTGIRTNISFYNYQMFGGLNFSGQVDITSLGAASRANRISIRSGTFSGSAVSGLTVQSFDAATGLFKGSFVASPPRRTINFEGIFVYNVKGEYYEGPGYFISNRFVISAGPPVMSSQRISGSVYIGSDN